MSIFGHNFKMNHIYELEDNKHYNKAQLNKFAIERFIQRNDEVNTLIFLTKAEIRHLESHVRELAPRGRTYSFKKPLLITYPIDSNNSFSIQKLTAVVTVAKRNNDNFRLYQGVTVKEGANYGVNPTITFKYGQIGEGNQKRYAIFHYENVSYSRPPENQGFSIKQFKSLNQVAKGNDVWLKPLFEF